MKDDKFIERMADEEELLRHLEINQFKEMIEAKTDEEREETKIIVGHRSFSLNQLLGEVQKGTKIGKTFLKLQARLRAEKARRGHE